ncbi:zinc metalloprotease HtpX [Candidatus Nitrosotalea okcheonensis]|uniref:Protease HtpX homolog n=1 Tax=Candidatus Nitrosotalea okcheonensis TaxID=1903276 RepID=A0A2H1FD80_9ARCH|nr:zinc metalloprotease HtpX [Candidatus Nitrosotalea okcheonensis]MDE1831877.1 zinc metalloprotease HtpX [Nitrososphaerota archaeon]SMH70723.1 Protease HtpX homolog 2 [Candidatus Nitrosotalea okcheonensis]
MQRDFQLTLRMAISFFALTMIYLAFLSFIAIYFGLGILPIAMIAGLMIGAQWYFSDRIVLWSTGTKITSKEEYPVLHQIIENLTQKANIPKPRVGIMASDVPNAFATGKGPKKSVIVVSTGILRILDKDELEGVLSHEITHIRNRDVTIITLASLFSTIAWYLMQSSMFSTMWGGYGYGGRQQGGNTFVVIIVAGIVWFLSFLTIRAISRYREFAADRGGAYLTGKPMNLSRALMKISGEVKTAPIPQLKKMEGMNAFFIIPAISGETIARFFSTHPPVTERVKRLMRIEQELRNQDEFGI